MDAGQIWSLLDKGGTLALLVLILVGGIKQWWVFGWTFKRETARGDRWEELALKGSVLIPRATSVAEELVAPARRQLTMEDKIDALTEEIALLRRESK